MKSKVSKNTKSVSRLGFPEPAEVKCFVRGCQKTFLINYNPAVGMPSQKNYWSY